MLNLKLRRTKKVEKTMIYSVYGFNFICEQIINKYHGRTYNQLEEKLPDVNIVKNDNLDAKMTDSVEIKNDDCVSKHSINKSYFCFNDGNSILITPKMIQFGGGKIDDKLIGGADIIILSRQHGRAVLHGSAFVYRKKAYLVCACPGAGKSTLSAAMSKYHKNISTLTDDIICVRNDGAAIYNGLSNISLNYDSYSYLQAGDGNPLSVLSPRISAGFKTIIDVKSDYTNTAISSYEIGGIFFLQEPLESDLIMIEELNEIELFYESLKNIKFRKYLVGELLAQEMKVINNMVNKNVFGVKIRIRHDYSQLHKITNMIIDYIDKRTTR